LIKMHSARIFEKNAGSEVVEWLFYFCQWLQRSTKWTEEEDPKVDASTRTGRTLARFGFDCWRRRAWRNGNKSGESVTVGLNRTESGCWPWTVRRRRKSTSAVGSVAAAQRSSVATSQAGGRSRCCLALVPRRFSRLGVAAAAELTGRCPLELRRGSRRLPNAVAAGVASVFWAVATGTGVVPGSGVERGLDWNGDGSAERATRAHMSETALGPPIASQRQWLMIGNTGNSIYYQQFDCLLGWIMTCKIEVSPVNF
jgi:hypothetical protein